MEALNFSMQRFLLFSIVLAIVATVSASASSCDAPNGFDADACEGYPDETLLLYPYNCNAYVNCTQECPVLNLCPPGKHFNEFLRICDTPASANCVEIPLTTTTPKPTLPPGVDPECCRNLAPGSLLNIDGDCEQFVKCDKDEEPEVLRCPRGRVFNEEMDLCDFVFDAGCNEPGVSTTPAPATTTTFNPIDACENQIPGTQLPHPTNCQQYVICESDVIYTLGCPPNMWYDPQSQKCGSDVSPTACLALPPPYTTRPPTTKASRLFASNRTSPVYEHKICGTQTNGETVSYPGNCRKFIACEDPVPVAYYCQDEYWYDQQSKSCVPAVLSDCREPGWTVSPPPSTTPKPTRPPPKGPCDGLPDGTLIPYPNDCTKYITCTRPINVGYDCPEGLEFNAEKRQCMRPEEANCSIKTTTEPTTVSTTPQRTTPSTPTPTTPTPTPTTPTPTPTTPTPTPTTPTPTPTTPKPTPTTPAPANACVNKIDGADLPYPKDCSKYIVCVKQEEMIVPCTAGNFYNPRTGICDKDGKSTCTA